MSRPRGGYIVFHPSHPGLILVEIDRDGSAWFSDDPWLPSPGGEHIVFTNIIESMKRGVYTKKGYDQWCIPNTRDKHGNLTAKKKDCTTLDKLFAPRKSRGSQVGLRAISEEDRYKGKVDWESNRGRIGAWIAEGISRGKIAGRLGVSPSTLSEANKRFGLYPPKKPVGRK